MKLTYVETEDMDFSYVQAYEEYEKNKREFEKTFLGLPCILDNPKYQKQLYYITQKYGIKKGLLPSNIFFIKHEDEYYQLDENSLKRVDDIPSSYISITYKDLKKDFEKDMQLNFSLLNDRVIDSLTHTDLEYIRSELSKIKTPTICSGVGGSNVVSCFASKVLNKKNNIIVANSEPRDLAYLNNRYDNVIACSYGGLNYGVDLAFNNNLKKYLLSQNKAKDDSIISLKYDTTMGIERSFISLAATLIPVSIILDYYLDGKNNEFLMEEETRYSIDPRNSIYEIFSGYDTETAATYLESTITESGLGIPIVHDKYDYCHGRSSLNKNFHTTAIYFDRNTEYDELMKEELPKYYDNIIYIKSKYKDQVLDDYQMLIQCMYLTKQLAEKKKIDLSDVDYSPITKKLYKYNGNI